MRLIHASLMVGAAVLGLGAFALPAASKDPAIHEMTLQLPGGGTETGAATLANFYPFGGQPFPQIFPLVSGPYTVAENNPVKYYDWYASYRASLFDDSLNLLAGVRDVKQDTALLTSTGQNRTTTTFGATDDYGYSVVQNPVPVHDLQATILHLLGIDHEKLTFKSQGRYFRLTRWRIFR